MSREETIFINQENEEDDEPTSIVLQSKYHDARCSLDDDLNCRISNGNWGKSEERQELSTSKNLKRTTRIENNDKDFF